MQEPMDINLQVKPAAWSSTTTALQSRKTGERKEYEFTWDQNDPVKLYAKIGENYYFATYANLKALAESPDIQLQAE